MWNSIYDDPLSTLHQIDGSKYSYSSGTGTQPQDLYASLAPSIKNIKQTAKLIEPGMQYYTDQMLKQCKKSKFSYHSLIFNMIGGISFVTILAILLWYCKKAKDDKDKNKDKIQEQQEMALLDTIKKMRFYDQKRKSELISNVPFESDLHHQDKIFM